ncbi:MAG: SDR family oxidoreductase [Clostridiales bacterium]|nr:SDR family oxidoreductase [Clostridiales bacterium]
MNVLITGASGGIGSAAARVFADHNYNVIINYNKNEDAANALVEELAEKGVKTLAYQADVSDEKQVDMMFCKAEKKFGFVDVLVNNAGVAQQKLFTYFDTEDYNRIFDINMRGTALCSRRALKSMIREHRGKIVNVSSMWGVCGASCEVLYSAAKGAVISFTKALAKEVGPSGINVNCVAPGVIDTKMNANLSADDLDVIREATPLGRTGKPEDVAELIYFLSSSKADFITGQIITVDGGLTI